MPLDYLAQNPVNTSLEFAPLSRHHDRDFLAGMVFQQPVDVTIVRCPDYQASVVTYSLDAEKSAELLSEIIRRYGFDVCKPSEEFIANIGEESVVEIVTYERAKKVSTHLGVALDEVWGAIRYANHLKNYHGFAEERSMKAAFERFGLSGFRDILR